jgi:hypothetical protein
LHLPQNHIHVHITSIGSYHDVVECDVVPMQACHILLGRPWKFDKDSMYHGRLNQYSFLHHDMKILLHLISPEAMMLLLLEKLNLMTMLKLLA